MDAVRLSLESVFVALGYLASTLLIRLLVLRIIFARSAFFKGRQASGMSTRQDFFRKLLYLVHSRPSVNEVVLGGGTLGLMLAATAVLPIMGFEYVSLERSETLFLVLIFAAGLVETCGLWLEGVEAGWRTSLKQLAALQMFVVMAYVISNAAIAYAGAKGFLETTKLNFLALHTPFGLVGFLALLAMIPFVVRDTGIGGARGQLAILKDRVLEVAMTTFVLLLFFNESVLEGGAHLLTLSIKTSMVLVIQELIRATVPLRRWDRKEALLYSGAMLAGCISLVGLWFGAVR